MFTRYIAADITIFHMVAASRLLALLLPLLAALSLHAETVTVSAAISMKESLQQIAGDYKKAGHDTVVFNFDASGKLAAQIRQGAPVDAFISADNEQMDKLEKTKSIDKASRRIVVGNSLVLIVPASAANPPRGFRDLAQDDGKKIAIGEPGTVPAGRYATQTFKSLKLDQAIAGRLVMAESVRQVLVYVEQDEVSAGIVYQTDAKLAGDKVKVVATAEDSSHDRIEYPAAIIAGSGHAAAAKEFLDYLTTEPARKVFTAHGFTFAAASTQPVTRQSR